VVIFEGVLLLQFLFGPWWRKPEFPEKTTDLPQVTDKLYHMEIALRFSQFSGC
jgi:hypothetical protein